MLPQANLSPVKQPTDRSIQTPRSPSNNLPADNSVLLLIYARIGDIEAVKNLFIKEEDEDFFA